MSMRRCPRHKTHITPVFDQHRTSHGKLVRHSHTHLFNAAPTATVFLASLIGFPRKAACVSAYNAALPAIVAERQRAGMKIVFTRVHEESGVCVGNTSDPRAGWCCAHMIHPTAAGYLRMASSFALAIAEHGWIVEETTGR